VCNDATDGSEELECFSYSLHDECLTICKTNKNGGNMKIEKIGKPKANNRNNGDSVKSPTLRAVIFNDSGEFETALLNMDEKSFALLGKPFDGKELTKSLRQLFREIIVHNQSQSAEQETEPVSEKMLAAFIDLARLLRERGGMQSDYKLNQ
jgi:hypothetical protein